MKKIKIKNKKKWYIIGGSFLLLLLIMITFGRYIYNDIRDFYLASKSFYFNSDKLTANRAIYQVDNWSAVDPYRIEISLNNSKNNLVHANSDIEYEISYTCSSNVICSVSKNSGTIYSSSETGIDSFSAVLTPNSTFRDGDQAFIEITASATSPYRKTISGRFVLKVGKVGLSYFIDDVAGRPYMDFHVTNTFDYYLVKQAFDDYSVNDRIDRNDYINLSDADKNKCVSALITLSFDPEEVILDMTSSAYLNSTSSATELIDGYYYVNNISFKMDSESSEVIRFYKADVTNDYTYPIVNNSSVVNFSYSQ